MKYEINLFKSKKQNESEGCGFPQGQVRVSHGNSFQWKHNRVTNTTRHRPLKANNQTVCSLYIDAEMVNVGPEIVNVGPEMVNVGPEMVNISIEMISIGTDTKTINIATEMVNIGTEMVSIGTNK